MDAKFEKLMAAKQKQEKSQPALVEYVRLLSSQHDDAIKVQAQQPTQEVVIYSFA